MNVRHLIQYLLISVSIALFLVGAIVPIEGIHAEDPEEETTIIETNFSTEDSSDDDSVPTLSYIDDEIDGENLLHTNLLMMAAPTEESSYYNLKDDGYVTSVKNQDPYGACWTFAIAASAESTYLKETGIALDLSELHMAYYAYHNYQKEDPLDLISDDGALTTLGIGKRSGVDFDYSLNIGGNNEFATALLSSGAGFVLEEDVPYSDALNMGSKEDELCYTRNYLLKNAEWYSMAISEQSIVKKAIVNYGAVATAFYWDSMYYNNETFGYCINSKTKTNHAIAIVGWDDNYSKENFINEPSGDGAWIAKNTWDTDWGDEGYFYISYYDTSLNQTNRLACQVFIEPAGIDENILEHDGGTMLTKASTNGTTVYEGSIFTSSRDEVLRSVGFMTGQANTSVTVSIYKDVSDDPTDGTKILSQNMACANAGYHTLDLTNEVELTEGETFSIVIRHYKYNADSIVTYMDCPYDASLKLNIYFHADTTTGLSFISTNGTDWSDYAIKFAGKPATARIKGYTYSLSDGVFESGQLTIQLDDDYEGFLDQVTGVEISGVTIPASKLSVNSYSKTIAINESTLVEYGLAAGKVDVVVLSQGYNSLYLEDVVIAPNRKTVPEYEVEKTAEGFVITSDDTDWMNALMETKPSGNNIVFTYRDIIVEFSPSDCTKSLDNKSITIDLDTLKEKLPGVNGRKYKVLLSAYGYEETKSSYKTSGLLEKADDFIYIEVDANGGKFSDGTDKKVFSVLRGEIFHGETPVKENCPFLEYRYEDGSVFTNGRINESKDIRLTAVYKGSERIEVVNTSTK